MEKNVRLQTPVEDKYPSLSAGPLAFVAGLIIWFILMAPAHSALGPALDSGWEEVSTDDGVTVHRREVEGSDLVAFRGEMTVAANIAKVASVLINTERKKQWMPKLEEIRELRQLGPNERLEYNHTASGFFAVRDRDFVLHTRAVLDKTNHRIRFLFNSVEDPTMPETDKVRGVIHEGEFSVTKLGENKTQVVVYVHADPKGSIPRWLVNFFQKHWPRKALKGLEEEALRPDLLVDPRLMEALPAISS